MVDKAQIEEKSRSQIKREFLEIKKLGIRLVALSRKQIETLPVSDETRDALVAAKGMTRTALQRQYRHIASLLADEDVDEVWGALPGKR